MIPNPIFNGMLINGQQDTPVVDELQQLQSEAPEEKYVYDFDKMENLVNNLKPDEIDRLSHRIWKNTEQEEASYAEFKDRVAFYLDLSGFQMPSRNLQSRRGGSSNDFIKNTGTSNLYSSALGETQLSIVTNVISKFFDGDEFVTVNLHGPLDPASGKIHPQVAEGIKTRVQKWYKMYFTHVLKNYRRDLESTLMWSCNVGTGDRKCYFDPTRGMPTSSLVPPGMLLNNSGYEGFYQATEYTHIYFLTRKEIQQRIDDGLWHENILSSVTYDEDDSILDQKLKEMQGKSTSISAGSSTSDEDDEKQTIYERYMDIELEDGSIMPVIVTYAKEGAIGAIYSNARGNDPLQLPVDYFVHYRFLPSFQGESMGLANVAGQNARAATVLKRRLIDASLAMAFPPAFVKPTLKFQSHTFETAPGKITTLPVGDDDISKAITFAPTATPNPFMTELKKDLEDQIRKYSLVVTQETMDLAQRAPQGSVLAMLSRLEEMPNCIIQGFYHSFEIEMNIFKRMFFEWLPDDEPFSMEMNGEVYTIYKNDFSEYVSIIPAAPYTKQSDAYKFMRGEIISQHAERLPQLHNLYQVYWNFYKDMGVEEDQLKQILVQPQPPQPADIILNEAKQLPQVHDMRAVLALYYHSKQIPPEIIEQILPPPAPPPQEAQQIDPGVVGMAEVEAQKQIAELNAHVKMAQLEVNKQEAETKMQIEMAKLDLSKMEQEKMMLELEMKAVKEQKELEIKERDILLKEKESEIEALKYEIDRHDSIAQKEFDHQVSERNRDHDIVEKHHERSLKQKGGNNEKKNKSE